MVSIMIVFYLVEIKDNYFLCLPKESNKEKAAANLFWDCHYSVCLRNTTHPDTKRVGVQTVLLAQSLRFADLIMTIFFQKRFEGKNKLYDTLLLAP